MLSVEIALLAATLGSNGAKRVHAIDPTSAATELLALTNISRTSNGLPALPRDTRLNSVGVSRSEDMIARNYFSHQIPPDNRTVVDILESLGVRFRSAGENIEWNTALDFSTVQFASDDFMNSPEHRANVLNRTWNRMGAGVFEGGGKRMYTVVFLLTQSDTPAPGGGPAAAPAAPPPAPRSRGERVQVAVAPAGLIDSLINRLLRLFLSV